ncbi:MAG: FixH family protein [Gammaproteobacteria bacterium]|jgi:uncharacterized protein
MRPPREDTKPWYRQFWPWFLISLPGAVVIASMVTIYIAVDTRDGLVQDDYYKKGLGIHKDAAKTATARQLNIHARLTYLAESGEVALALNEAAVGRLDSLQLIAFHPTRDSQDQEVSLLRADDGTYRGVLQTLAPANWRMSIEPPGGQWRISGRLAVPQATTAELQ